MALTLLMFFVAAPPEEPTFNGLKASEWIAMAKDDPLPRKRKAALISLGQMVNEKSKDTILTAVARSMRSDSQAVVRLQAALVLGQQPAETLAGYITDLSEGLRQEKDASVKREIATALGRLGKAAQAGVLPLIDALKDAPEVKTAAADTLGRIGGGAHTAVPALLPLLKDPNPEVRRAAVFALGRVEPPEPDSTVAAIIALLAELNLTQDKEQTLAAWGGGIIARNRNCELISTAVISLGLLGVKTNDVAKAIANQFRDPDVEVRQQSALALAKLTVAARSVDAELKHILKSDPDRLVRTYAIHAFGAAYAAEPDVLIATFSDRFKSESDFEVRIALVDELGGLGPAGAAALPFLREAQRDTQVKVREAASMAIKRITKPATAPKP